MAFNKAYGSLILLLTILCDVIPYVLAYANHTIEDHKICAKILKPNIIILGESNKSGLIIQESSYFTKFTSEKLECRFKVRASFNFGLFAVIQRMNFRRDLESGECLDYVQFRHYKTNHFSEIFNVNVDVSFKKDDADWGYKYCDSLSAFEAGTIEHPFHKGVSLNGFVEEKGRMEVLIVISNHPSPRRANLSLEIAFTSYQECTRDIGAYRMCGNNTCIWKNYFQDGIVNCPYVICTDEGGCEETNELFTSLGTKVTITAVSSIFISFFLFLGCIWLCRYFEILCWGINNIRHRNNPVEMDPMHSSAPSSQPQHQTQIDKDLPPSYETLFPDR